eukprot:TRINITY_DN8671_c0_g1_i1.p1 TRINITY_DN8671_c0_g1~~TRINITY_DN8671_c0_g1_i1.p1  ORF type:complete len:228 (+),score=51.07 TRINITY_DN8671_c0_g1_i1:309-992(+)
MKQKPTNQEQPSTNIRSPSHSPTRGERERHNEATPSSPSPTNRYESSKHVTQSMEAYATQRVSSASPPLQSASPTLFPNLRPNFSPTNIHRPNTTELLDSIKVSARRFSLSGMYPHITPNSYKMDEDATAEDFVTWTAPYVRKKFQILPAIPPLNFSTINMSDAPPTPTPPKSAPSTMRRGCDSPLMTNPPIQPFSARPPPKIPVKLRKAKKEQGSHAHVLSQKARK